MIAQSFDAYPTLFDDVPAWDCQYTDAFVDITAPPPPTRPRFDSSVTEASSYSLPMYDAVQPAPALEATTPMHDVLLFENMFTNSNCGAVIDTTCLDPRPDPTGDATTIDWLLLQSSFDSPAPMDPFLMEAPLPVMHYPVQPPPAQEPITIVPSSFFVPGHTTIASSPASTVSELSLGTPDSIRASTSLPTVTIDFSSVFDNTVQHSSYAYPVVPRIQRATMSVIRTGDDAKNPEGKVAPFECCGKTFSKKSNWVRHVRSNHDDTAPKIKCPYCRDVDGYSNVRKDRVKDHAKRCKERQDSVKSTPQVIQ